MKTIKWAIFLLVFSSMGVSANAPSSQYSFRTVVIDGLSGAESQGSGGSAEPEAPVFPGGCLPWSANYDEIIFVVNSNQTHQLLIRVSGSNISLTEDANMNAAHVHAEAQAQAEHGMIVFYALRNGVATAEDYIRWLKEGGARVLDGVGIPENNGSLVHAGNTLGRFGTSTTQALIGVDVCLD